LVWWFGFCEFAAFRLLHALLNLAAHERAPDDRAMPPVRDLGIEDSVHLEDLGVTIDVHRLYDGVLPLKGGGPGRSGLEGARGQTGPGSRRTAPGA
jgi:hypothetical protein